MNRPLNRFIHSKTGLYIHIPWCVRKCPYCDFNSHEQSRGFDEPGYVSALLKDVDYTANEYPDVTINSIFIGGGTPSLFSGKAIATLLDHIRQTWPFSDDAEITIETNPGTADSSNYNEYRQAGVNRLSIGAQSFNNDLLFRLGRIHSARETVDAVALARQAGFENINLDLMYGLPTQTAQMARADLLQAAELDVAHISWYQLTLERNTLFFNNPPVLPDEDTVDDITTLGSALLNQHGYEQYEISAWCRPDKQCRHNISYWEFADYLGIGAGAHGKRSLKSPASVLRTTRVRHPKDYLRYAGSTKAQQQSETDKPEDIVFEYVMNRFRLAKPLLLTDFEAATGLPADKLVRFSAKAVDEGLVAIDQHTLVLTETGKRYLNNTLLCYLPDNRQDEVI